MPFNNVDNLIYTFKFHLQHNQPSDLSHIAISSEILRHTIDYKHLKRQNINFYQLLLLSNKVHFCNPLTTHQEYNIFL